MKKFVIVMVLTVAGISFLCAQTPSLTLDAAQYAPGAKITVSFTAPSAYASDAWIGIIPSKIPHGTEAENDKHDISYQYIQKKTSGTMVFTAPTSAGNYDMRMHDTDSNGKEVAYVSFTVGAATSQSASLSISRANYQPGEKIHVTFTASASFPRDAWIGILPAHIPHGSEAENDKHDLTYQYLEKKTTGTLIFTAPTASGNYDLRMHDTDNNGKEIAYVSFTVSSQIQSGSYSSGQVSLAITKTAFEPGEKITVSFTAPASFDASAWIGIIPSKVRHGSEEENDKHDLVYQYIQKKTTGVMTFSAPNQPGTYDFRMHDTDNNGKEVGYVTFTVR